MMSMRVFTAAAILACVAGAAAAESWDCSYDVECLDLEECLETDYGLSLGAHEGRYLMSDIAGERPMDEVGVLDSPDLRGFVSMVQALSVQLITIYPDGTSHYTVHSPDYSVRYSGTCEARS